MYKRILVPLDGSKRAEAILPQVEEMAQCFEAQLILMQVIESYLILADPYGAIAPNIAALEQ